MTAGASIRAHGSPGERARAPIAFFGSGAFGVPILDALAASAVVRVVGVVGVPDRPAGRGGRLSSSPVVERARALGIPVLQPASLRDPRTVEEIGRLGAVAVILADYGRIVPPEVLALPSRGFLNVHPSLLPRHRGATPVQATVLAGDERAGVTLFEMDRGLDTGPIVASTSWPLAGSETGPALEREAAGRGAALLDEVLGPWLAGERPAVAQPEAGVTLTRPLRREDGRLDPTRPASELERQVRALAGWPGTFLEAAPGRLVVVRAAAIDGVRGDRPGAIVPDDGGLALTTAEGRLRLLEVRPAGGRTMSGADLRRGRPAFANAAVLTGAGVGA